MTRGRPSKGVPKCQICFGTIFSCIPISHSSVPYTLPALFPYPFSLPFHPSRPFPKEVNKTERAPKNTNAKPSANILYALQYRLAGGTNFRPVHSSSVRPSVRLFVRSFVCYQLVKTNEPISVQIGINLSPGHGHEGSTSGVTWSSAWSRSKETEVIIGSLAETSFLIT